MCRSCVPLRVNTVLLVSRVRDKGCVLYPSLKDVQGNEGTSQGNEGTSLQTEQSGQATPFLLGEDSCREIFEFGDRVGVLRHRRTGEQGIPGR
jgi:hypothetical protein